MAEATVKTNVTTMYLASMDHTPSEQLGEPEDWHTTVLILSEAAQHWKLAEDVAKQLRCRDARLTKWSRNPVYRRSGAFEKALKKRLPGSAVYIRAISAQAHTIRASYSHMIEQLGLIDFVKKIVKNDKPYLKFGPFQRVKIVSVQDDKLKTQSEPTEFDIIERQAVSLIFICHYLLRMHQQMMLIVRKQQPAIEWIDWQLMPNTFPGDLRGPMSSLFHAIMSGATSKRLVNGNIRIAPFNSSNDDLGSALADNIAGLFAGKLDDQKYAQSTFGTLGELVDWEIWSGGVC